MPSRIFDFHCKSCEKTFEGYVNTEVREVSCACGSKAERIVSPVACQLDHTFPGQSIKWAKQHEQGAGKKYTH